MSWLSHGLPYPHTVYAFEDHAGISRTPFFMGYRGQEQRWKNSWRTYRLEFILEGNKLRALEVWLWTESVGGFNVGGGGGYEFRQMPLISESNLYPPVVGEVPPEQWCRIIETPVVTAMGHGTQFGVFRVTVTVETKYNGEF